MPRDGSIISMRPITIAITRPCNRFSITIISSYNRRDDNYIAWPKFRNDFVTALTKSESIKKCKNTFYVMIEYQTPSARKNINQGHRNTRTRVVAKDFFLIKPNTGVVIHRLSFDESRNVFVNFSILLSKLVTS